jgi:hypothetical protein
MKGTSPSKASREQLELRFTATEYQDGEVKLFINSTERGNHWAAAGFKDTLLRWKMKPEVVYGNKKAIQPGVQA